MSRTTRFLRLLAAIMSARSPPLLYAGAWLAPQQLHEIPKSRKSTHSLASIKADSDTVLQIETKRSPSWQTRRDVLQDLWLVGSLPMTTIACSSAAAAAAEKEDPDNIAVYFGCGCFWHVQHELAVAERNLLKRTDMELTARAGYAGGNSSNQVVCYHNAANIGDYGSLGHAEVVQVIIPESKLYDFVLEYTKLFSKQGYRPDQWGDRGSEYRNLVGLPAGGTDSKYVKTLIEASRAGGDKLDFARGRGNDPDRRGLVFVMDTANFPFHVAEQYHQFHDGFNLGENYPSSYNELATRLAKENKLGTSTCPNGLLGIGAFGL